MKKILLFALMLTAVQLGAQTTREIDAALKAYQKSKDEVNGRRAQDAAAWVRFGKALTNVYEVPTKNLWVGLSSMEARVILKDIRPTGTEQMTIGGEVYDVVHYADKDLYYAEDGRLAFWVVTKPLIPQDILGDALNAFSKAYELDARGSQRRDITAGISGLQTRYVAEGMTANAMTNFSLASKHFGNAVLCSEHQTVNQLDTAVVFYAGLMAFYANEYERAIHYVQRALDLGWAQEGAAYSILANCYKHVGRENEVERVLVAGFTKFPSNQSILIDLINLYMERDEDPEKIMEYIHSAQRNEPDNPSLYYAEGNIWRNNLGNLERAAASFQKSIEVNPRYAYSHYTLGVLYYDAAVDVQNKASDELDDAKWNAMMEEMEQYLEKAIEPFEQCFAITEDEDLKADVAIYLRHIYYRLQGKNEAYQAAYEKYNAIMQKND